MANRRISPYNVEVILKPADRTVACPGEDRCQLELIKNDYPDIMQVGRLSYGDTQHVHVGLLGTNGGCDYTCLVGLCRLQVQLFAVCNQSRYDDGILSTVTSQTKQLYDCQTDYRSERYIPVPVGNVIEEHGLALLAQMRYVVNATDRVSLLIYDSTEYSAGESKTYLNVRVLAEGSIPEYHFSIDKKLSKISAAMSRDCDRIYIAYSQTPETGDAYTATTLSCFTVFLRGSGASRSWDAGAVTTINYVAAGLQWNLTTTVDRDGYVGVFTAASDTTTYGGAPEFADGTSFHPAIYPDGEDAWTLYRGGSMSTTSYRKYDMATGSFVAGRAELETTVASDNGYDFFPISGGLRTTYNGYTRQYGEGSIAPACSGYEAWPDAWSRYENHVYQGYEISWSLAGAAIGTEFSGLFKDAEGYAEQHQQCPPSSGGTRITTFTETIRDGYANVTATRAFAYRIDGYTRTHGEYEQTTVISPGAGYFLAAPYGDAYGWYNLPDRFIATPVDTTVSHSTTQLMHPFRVDSVEEVVAGFIIHDESTNLTVAGVRYRLADDAYAKWRVGIKGGGFSIDYIDITDQLLNFFAGECVYEYVDGVRVARSSSHFVRDFHEHFAIMHFASI